MCVFLCDSIFVESTYSKANAPQPHEILVKSEPVTYTTDSAATLRIHSTDINKVITQLSCHVDKSTEQYLHAQCQIKARLSIDCMDLYFRCFTELQLIN